MTRPTDRRNTPEIPYSVYHHRNHHYEIEAQMSARINRPCEISPSIHQFQPQDEASHLTTILSPESLHRPRRELLHTSKKTRPETKNMKLETDHPPLTKQEPRRGNLSRPSPFDETGATTGAKPTGHRKGGAPTEPKVNQNRKEINWGRRWWS